MRALGIKVHKGGAEKLRKELVKRGLIIPELKPKKEGGAIIFPVSEEAKNAIRGYEFVETEFEERRRIRTYKEIVKIPEELRRYLPTSFDVIGDIAIVKFSSELLGYEKEVGEAMIKAYKNVKAVYKDEGVRGEYRVRALKHVAGHRRTVTRFKEYGITFEVDVARVYVSPRLGEEHKLISEMVQPGEVVFDMFSGYGPFAIFCAKKGAFSYSTDINPYAIHYLEVNSRINKVSDKVLGILSDCRKVPRIKADHVIMNLPHSSQNFLPYALKAVEKGWLHMYVIVEEGREEERGGEIEGEILSYGYEVLSKFKSGGKAYSPGKAFIGFHFLIRKSRSDS